LKKYGKGIFPESELFVDLMATIEYINLLFKKIDTLSFLDPVVKGVLLVTSEDLAEILFKITEQYFGTESPEETIKELNDLVGFLGYYSQKIISYQILMNQIIQIYLAKKKLKS